MQKDEILEKAKKKIKQLVSECEVENELEIIRNSRVCDVADLIEA